MLTQPAGLSQTRCAHALAVASTQGGTQKDGARTQTLGSIAQSGCPEQVVEVISKLINDLETKSLLCIIKLVHA